MKIRLVWATLSFALIYICPIARCMYSDEIYKSKYEYKYSFKGPNLSQQGKGIPFWNHTFDAVPGEDQVRIVPSLKAKFGAVWAKNTFPSEEWKVEIHFRIQGRGRVGADGFAFWYVETPNAYGPVFGSLDNWNGLGIFFDSYDNDGGNNNPYISVLVNNGSISFDHAHDGAGQIQGGCHRDFRNRPYPVKAKIVYADHVLEMYIDSGNTPTAEYEFCTAVKNIDLPKDLFFGISAATGGLADDHDILKFLTWSLKKKTEDDQPDQPVDEEAKKKEEEQKKLQEEYEKNLQEFYTEQKKFQQEHPDKVKKEVSSPDELFQGGSSTELQAVFEVQSKIKEKVMELSKSVVLVMEKQDKVVAQLEQYKPPDVNLAKSHEIENISKMQGITNDAIKELNDHISFIKSTTSTLSESISKLDGVKTKVEIPYESDKQLNQVMKKLDALYSGMTDLGNKQKASQRVACPEPDMPSCVSTSVLIAVALLQVIIFIAYQSYKNSRENAAKKFF